MVGETLNGWWDTNHGEAERHQIKQTGDERLSVKEKYSIICWAD